VTPDDVRREKAALEERFGAWTAHNIELAPGFFTMSERPTGDEVKLRRVVQVVSDVLDGDVAGARVLDLACLEGMYAIELARRGAEVVAIEGREANIEKARFAARAVGVDVTFVHGDVRELARERHGEFDVVLALGILYHLDAPDLFRLVEAIASVCRRALVVDTGTALREEESFAHDGHAYAGRRLVEHAPDSSEQERLDAVWSSLDNLTAVALTRASLETLLARSGFTSLYECHVPAEPAKQAARVTLLALKGVPVGPLLAPGPDEDAATVPEQAPMHSRFESSWVWSLGRVVPKPLRARVRRLLGAETRHH
jgi:SAM-dependent methyltransferase